MVSDSLRARVVVTGAAQGQGAAEVRRLGAGGAIVIATDIQPIRPSDGRRALGRKHAYAGSRGAP